MLRLSCSQSATSGLQSRIAVLDVGHPIYNFALAAGHAVPSDRPCVVKDFDGKSSNVDLIRFPADYQPGQQSDWAVIRFPRIDTRNLVKYKLEPLADLDNLEGTQVLFAEARGLPENSQVCHLTILQFKAGHKRVAHDCRAISGQSGSPVTRVVEGQNRLVGLNIGRLWMFESPKTGRPDRKGYINLLDRKTVADIQTLIDEIR